MDKTKWPQALKDQYNEEIRQRRMRASIQNAKDNILHAHEFPQIWNLNLSEETVFPFIAYEFPLHRVLENLLQRFIPTGMERELRLGEKYLRNTRNAIPAYFSDRERATVILNRFQNNDEWEELFHWISFFSARGNHPHMHLMLGIIFLDKYLRHSKHEVWLQQSIHHLKKVENWVEREDSRKALAAVQALGFYLNRDFNRALGYLGVRQKKTFEEDFAELIDRVAA